MDEKKVKFLRDINDGKIKGAQRLIAKSLGIAESSVSIWFTDNKKPSLDSILKMAEIFKKSEEEIREIFDVKQNQNFAAVQSNEDFYRKEIALRDDFIKSLKEQTLIST